MDNIAYLKTCYQYLCDHIDSFSDFLLSDGKLISATVYEYPTFTDEDVDVWPESIELTPLNGEAALLRALDWMKKNSIVDRQSGRIVPRLPGTIVYHHPQSVECLMRLERINELKNHLKDAIANISTDEDVRFEIVKIALPNLIKKVATRHFIYANRPVKSVSFSWVHRLTGENKSKKQVLILLQKSLDYRNKNSIADPHFIERVEQDIVKISQMPQQSKFVIRRPIRVTPMLNLNYVKDTMPHLALRTASKMPSATSPKNYVAHSPVFIFDDLPKVYPFKNYNENLNKRLSPAHLDSETLVIERLYLYRKNSEYE
jgi:DNA replication terminus site-binding protein